jgi:hypothetical protein
VLRHQRLPSLPGLLGLALAGVALATPLSAAAPTSAAARAAPSGPVTVVAVGDIACDPADPAFNNGAGTATTCRMRATSDQALTLQPAAVLLLGDLQYENASLDRFHLSFDPTWGRLKAISRPAVGNHEYLTPGAAGYYAYFGAAAGDPHKGYYSFDLGGWHLVSLNSNCEQVGGCGDGSPQIAWLRSDLQAHAGHCTLAYWHHPRFSSSLHGTDATYGPFWAALQGGATDLALVGHDHVYERFAPQDAAGGDDPLTGIRELVVGTGGRLLYGFNTPQPHSEVRIASFGVLALTLYPNGYLFRFLPVDGGSGDSGGALCHAVSPGPAPSFHPLATCRAMDTTRPAAATGGPALRGSRDFPLRDVCGVPADAVAVAVRVTATRAAGRGRLTLFPAGAAPPAIRTLDLRGGRDSSIELLLPLGVQGAVTAVATLPQGGSVHLKLDVTGYFR